MSRWLIPVLALLGPAGAGAAPSAAANPRPIAGVIA
jgi:hypothetical protein